MRHLAEALLRSVTRDVRERLASTTGSRCQIALAGLPRDVVEPLFNLMTSAGTSDWQPAGEGPRLPVYLVGPRRGPVSASSVESRHCHWDYIVEKRDTEPRFLMLVAPEARDDWPDSIYGATETLVCPTPVDDATFLAPHGMAHQLLEDASTSLGVSIDVTEASFRHYLGACEGLDGTAREAHVWRALAQLFDAVAAGRATADVLLAATGLPPVGSDATLDPDAIDACAQSVKLLADYVGEHGFTKSFNDLRAAAPAPEVAEALTELQAHLSAAAEIAPKFGRAGQVFFRPGFPTPAWWTCLERPALDAMLAELGVATPQAGLLIRCTNALNNPGKGTPSVVVSRPDFVIRPSDDASEVHGVELRRRAAGRSGTTVYGPGDLRGSEACSDVSPPRHSKPLRYDLDAPGAKAASISVLVLDCFEHLGLVTTPGADSLSIPKAKRPATRSVQDVTVSSAGTVPLVVYAASHVAKVRVEGVDYPVVANAASFLHSAETETVVVELLDRQGAVLGAIEVHVLLEDEDDELPGSAYEALVTAHVRRRQPKGARAREGHVRTIERGYLDSAESWRPVFVAASRVDHVPPPIVWDDPRLMAPGVRMDGDVRPPAAAMQPPAHLLNARERVRAHLLQDGTRLPEADLTSDALQDDARAYVEAYADWVRESPQVACWLDVLAIHEPQANPQAGATTAESEPIALLLSPLHPLRVGWHAFAHRTLKDGLVKPSPLAGLFTPHTCPDFFGLGLWRGPAPSETKPYVSVALKEVHWALLWDADRLKGLDESETLLFLKNLGLDPRSVEGSFSAQQTKKSLDEAVRLLPLRATLRVGVYTERAGASECTKGLSEWARDRYGDDDGRQQRPARLEVHDYRAEEDAPDADTIATLSSATGERTTWFQPKRDTLAVDLVLLDQLGLRNPRMASASARSALGAGVLHRLRVRHDVDGAKRIYETRTGSRRTFSEGLPGAIERAVTAIERLGQDGIGGSSHLTFEPNQFAIGQRLQRSTFVAVSSSDIDTACFTRGTTAQDAYLWDYEVPPPEGLSDPKPGFYLVARPSDVTKRAVASAMAALTDRPPDIEMVLREVSKRGLPVLKRLATGGNSAKGELGTLLTARLLQDSFGETPRRALLPVQDASTLRLIVPVDPYHELFDEVRKALFGDSKGSRPDLLLFVVEDACTPPRVTVLPIEVKYRDAPMPTSALEKACEQARNLSRVLKDLWERPGQSQADATWRYGGRAVLGHMLDQAFRLYGDPSVCEELPLRWSERHSRVLASILEGDALTRVLDGRVVVCTEHGDSEPLHADNEGRPQAVQIGRDDAANLLLGQEVSRQLDAAVRSAIVEGVTDWPSAGNADGIGPPLPSSGDEAAGAPAPEAAEAAPSGRDRPEAPHVEGPEGTGRLLDDEAPVRREGISDGEAEVGRESEPPPVATVPPDTVRPVSGAAPARAFPEQVRQRIDDGFRGFIGNTEAVEYLRRDLKVALIESPPHLPKNYLFTGPPSAGKTTLAHRIASVLALPFVKLDGRGVVSRDRLFELVDGELRGLQLQPERKGERSGKPVLEYPPVVVFVDEAHLMQRAVQESFLTMLESRDRTVLLEDRVALVGKCTFLFATTRASDLDGPFRTRCREVQLRAYTEPEVAQMIALEHPDWGEGVCLRLARLGRSVPRIALELARDLHNELRVTDHPERSLADHLEYVRMTTGIDDNGITRQDVEYLQVLDRQSGPIGERVLLAALATADKDRIVDEIEPFLERLAFIRRTPRGREITSQGRTYLRERRTRA